jgi:hypothetical protein
MLRHNIKKLASHTYSLQQFCDLIKNVDEKSTIEEFPFHVPIPYSRRFQRKVMLENTYGEFKECPCDENEFNRHQNQRRQNIENLIVVQAIQHFRCGSTLVYLSLGAGELLQDLIICAQLLLAGYSLRVRLIEPHQFELKLILPAFISLLTQLAELVGRTFEAETFAFIADYHKKYPDERIHVASAIDFDVALKKPNCFFALIETQELLDEHGFFYLAFDDYDYLFDKTKCIYDYYHGASFFGWKPFFDEKEYQQAMQIPKAATIGKTVKEIAKVPSAVTMEIFSYLGFFLPPQRPVDYPADKPRDVGLRVR